MKMSILSLLLAGLHVGVMYADDKNTVSKVAGAGDTLDDIEDLPAFLTWPSGAYRVTLVEGLEEKEINKNPATEMAMTLVETMEMTEAVQDEKDIPKVGDVCSTAYMRNNKVGAGKLKEILKVFAEKLGTRNIGEIMQGSKGLQCLVVLNRTYDKDKDRHYANVKSISVL